MNISIVCACLLCWNMTIKPVLEMKGFSKHLIIGLSLVLLLTSLLVLFDTEYITPYIVFTYIVSSAVSLSVLALPVYVNIYYYIPKYLITQRYFIYTLFLIVFIIAWGYILGYTDTWLEKALYDTYTAPDVEGGVAMMVLISLVSTLANLSYRWVIQRTKIRQIQNDHLNTELSLLKNQINPHFFFNTLNNLYALALEKSTETPDVILKLSDMMRYTIYDCKASTVQLRDEIMYMENYIALQKMRHHEPGTINFEKNVADQSKMIAPMILIVFLENAFKHGFDTMKEKAYINIKLRSAEDLLHMRIENNFEDVQEEGNGIGLENVKKRLSLMYPGKHTLEFLKEQDRFIADLKLDLV